MSAVLQPTRYQWDRQTYERMVDVGLFPPHSHAELINGDIIEISPQGTRHYTVLSLLESALRESFSRQFTIRNQGPFIVSDSSEPEPDLAVVAGTARDYLHEHPKHALLLVEIADTTLHYDRMTKAALYAGCGVPEYWVVNLPENCIEVFRAPQRDRYTSVSAFYAGDHVVPIHAEKAVFVDDVLA